MIKTPAILLSVLLLAGCNTTAPDQSASLERRIGELEAELAQVRMERNSFDAERSVYRKRAQEASEGLTHARARNTELQSALDVASDEFQRARGEWQRKYNDLSKQAVEWSVPGGAGIEVERDADGNLHLSVPSEILFQPGSEVIGKGGKQTLDTLYGLINEQFAAHKIEIAGHTDNDPIKRTKNRFTTNMDLSLARASAVYKYFWDKGLHSPERIRATGYGEFHPKVDNSDKASKRKNRRVEVVVFRH